MKRGTYLASLRSIAFLKVGLHVRSVIVHIHMRLSARPIYSQSICHFPTSEYLRSYRVTSTDVTVSDSGSHQEFRRQLDSDLDL